MLNLNHAQVLGNLTRDGEMRYTPNGQAVLNFSVATNRRWKNKDGSDGEATEFHNIVVWGKQAENVGPMLKKGEPVLVEGRLQTRSWEGQDSVKRYRTEIIADNVIVLRGKSNTSSAGSQENPVEKITKETDSKTAKKDDETKSKNDKEEEIDIEEIPF